MTNRTEYVVRSRWHLYLIIFILLALVAWQNWPRQKPDQPVIAPGYNSNADLNVTATHEGTLAGHVPLKPVKPVDDGTPGTTPPINAILDDFDYTVPVTGTIHAKYWDARTKKLIGEGDYPVTGTTRVWTAEGNLFADTKFQNTVDFNITLPKRKWEAGLYGGGTVATQPIEAALFAGIYGERIWDRITARGEVQVGTDGWRVNVKVEVPVF
jgi:hypothetical protein